ncbi:ExeA family protein [Ralstonia pseudosolanacearum]|uniref:ExeA family protein n=1 Tax=Ralstonia pseudosolanacearum TaxID=1310165 RepID=UPI0007D85069|nr:AAA family ATPase [Ralstonia pseudosolanacearum]MDD7787803.1 AAA family ATPase [Ralstonia pseudosolanacearum]MDN3369423.1 AAA family ATPase [Ralstonia pseudosolanacearum]OAK89626.1 ATPase AAA [Ralstonia pseudosolanacearum]QOK89136.1 AAA family ATPase [Ralstonia pseudosolanacearum]
MRAEVMQHYGLAVPLNQAGFFETEHHQQLMKDIKGAILEGRLIAVCGVVGCGKTMVLRRLQEALEGEKRVTVSKSLAIEKHRIKLATLVAALFYDLSTEKQVRIPTQGEKRERDLRELVRKNKRPVALFVDEAHDLNGNTLIGLKRLMELVEDGDGRLSVILAGHPKLRNDLRRATMEEIGYRTDIFSLDGIAGSQREYIRWLLGACTGGETDVESIMTEDAIDLLSTKLRTPLQIQLHLALAFDAGYLTGERPVSAELVESVLSRQLDELEPTLTRHGYRLKDLVEQFDAKPAEIRALFTNSLDPLRAATLRDKMLAAGLPI